MLIFGGKKSTESSSGMLEFHPSNHPTPQFGRVSPRSRIGWVFRDPFHQMADISMAEIVLGVIPTNHVTYVRPGSPSSKKVHGSAPGLLLRYWTFGGRRHRHPSAAMVGCGRRCWRRISGRLALGAFRTHGTAESG